jgi:hypothetical protein
MSLDPFNEKANILRPNSLWQPDHLELRDTAARYRQEDKVRVCVCVHIN